MAALKTPWYDKAVEVLKLNGKGERTQEAYARHVRKLIEFHDGKDPDRIIGNITTFHNYAYLSIVYSCGLPVGRHGLRLQEGLFLQVSDIDGGRKFVHVHRGKGAKDRYVPLPETTYHLLRNYWSTHRNPKLIFPALGRGENQGRHP